MAYNIKVLGAWTISRELFLPVAFNTIAQETGVATNTVGTILNQFCSACTLTPFWKGGDVSSKISAGDLGLIETLKTMPESISLRELQAVLTDIGDMQDISLLALSKVRKSKILSGKRYTQLFINFLSSKDPAKVKFFNEARIKTSDCGTRLYGNLPAGERCVEIARKVESPNIL